MKSVYKFCPTNIFVSISILLCSTVTIAQQATSGKELPNVISPGQKGTPPSDAIIVFSNGSLSAFESSSTSGAALWKVAGKKFVVAPGTGNIQTKQKFGDCQLHIEWKTDPKDVKAGKKGQGSSNSGIYLMGKYEVQVLNSYINETDPDRQAGAIYKQHIPLVNASRKPGKWQVYDIIFKAPGFDESGKQLMPGIITLFHNGVLVQNHVEIKGPTRAHNEMLDITDTELPLMLQDHKSKVSYRNIWIRKL